MQVYPDLPVIGITTFNVDFSPTAMVFARTLMEKKMMILSSSYFKTIISMHKYKGAWAEDAI